MLIPNGRVVYTDPLKWDTDGDSLTDGEEMGNIENFEDQSFIKKVTLTFKGFNSLVYAQYYDYQSNPTKVDTDGDGIKDNEELGPNSDGKSYSNPLTSDSDNDGIKDFNDPNPLTYNKEKEVAWDVWNNVDVEDYMTKRNITEIIFKGVHLVAFENYHTSIIVIVAPDSKYYEAEYFVKDGADWSNNWDNVHYVTLGAGPGWGLSGDPLTCDYNREKDVILDIKVQMINLTTSPEVNTHIDQLIEHLQYLKDLSKGSRPSYDLFPKDEDKQNSNSYAAGLLIVAGINDLGEPKYNVPGYKYPVPKKYFSE